MQKSAYPTRLVVKVTANTTALQFYPYVVPAVRLDAAANMTADRTAIELNTVLPVAPAAQAAIPGCPEPCRGINAQYLFPSL
jgi:hypothetical protein